VKNSSPLSFSDGALVALAIYSLYQDYLGLEGYIQYLHEGWMPSAFSVPLAALGIIYVIYQGVRRASHAKSFNYAGMLRTRAVEPESIDTFIGIWHSTPSWDRRTLPKFLGITEGEFARWVENNSLYEIRTKYYGKSW
jgi:hypothetical protein